MDNCWGILGIEATSDKRTIKLAYAKQLKTTRPDQDAAGFSRLHDAYQEAQWLAEGLSSIDFNDVNTVQNINITSPYLSESFIGTNTALEVSNDALTFFEGKILPNEWFNEFERLFYSKSGNEIKKWQILLLDIDEIDEETKIASTKMIVHKLRINFSHVRNLTPSGFWEIIEANFEQLGWRKDLILLFSKELGWWANSEKITWQNEFESSFVQSLFNATATNYEQKLWRVVGQFGGAIDWHNDKESFKRLNTWGKFTTTVRQWINLFEVNR